MNEHRILKYELPAHSGEHEILVQGGRASLALSVADQNGKLVVWVTCNEHYALAPKRFIVRMTGERPPDASRVPRFLGTVLFDGGVFVLHVWDAM